MSHPSPSSSVGFTTFSNVESTSIDEGQYEDHHNGLELTVNNNESQIRRNYVPTRFHQYIRPYWRRYNSKKKIIITTITFLAVAFALILLISLTTESKKRTEEEVAGEKSVMAEQKSGKQSHDPSSSSSKPATKTMVWIWKEIQKLKKNVTRIDETVQKIEEDLTLAKKVLGDKEFEENLGTMISNPQAILYTKEHHEEDRIIYNEEGSENPACLTLSNFLTNSSTSNQKRIQSIDTADTCVRLYTEADCTGFSLPYYTGGSQKHESDILLTAYPNFTEANSIGPCLQNELDGSSLATVTWKNLKINVFTKPRYNNNTTYFIPEEIFVGRPVKGLHFTNLKNFSHHHRHGGGESQQNDDINMGSIEAYSKSLLGPSRILYLESILLNTSHVRKDWEIFADSFHPPLVDDYEGEDVERLSFLPGYHHHQKVESNFTKYFTKLPTKIGDTMGLAIGLKFGGPRRSILNIFPQSPQNQRRLTILEAKLVKILRVNPELGVKIKINFDYLDPEMMSEGNGCRPSGFSFRVDDEKNMKTLLFHYVSNQ